MPLNESKIKIDNFLANNGSWVVEGCYSDLLSMVIKEAQEVVFLNLPISECISNAKKRPWEPHKYPSKKAQDQNLEMLIDWIAQYELRTDSFSKKSHCALYDGFQGKKTMYTSNTRYK